MFQNCVCVCLFLVFPRFIPFYTSHAPVFAVTSAESSGTPGPGGALLSMQLPLSRCPFIPCTGLTRVLWAVFSLPILLGVWLCSQQPAPGEPRLAATLGRACAEGASHRTGQRFQCLSPCWGAGIVTCPKRSVHALVLGILASTALLQEFI